METTPDKVLSPIQRAVAALGWGGQTSLARELSKLGKPCTPQAVQKWCATGHVPDDRIEHVERITGVRLRDDPPPSPEQAAA